MANFRMDNDLFYDIKSGTAMIHGDNNGDLKSFAVVVRGGHCGNGYYIPIILTIFAKNKETAIKIAGNIGRVKKTAKHIVIAIEEISELQHYALEYINDCDPYFNNYYDTESMPDVYERRIIIETVVDKENFTPKNKNRYEEDLKPNYKKVPKDLTKTANKYDDIHVLQRYLAPQRYGEKLIFPKKLNLKAILNEYLEKNLYQLGIVQGKASAVSFYFQLFGLHNRAGVHYKDKCLIFYDQEGQKRYIKVPDQMVPHLKNARQEFVKKAEAHRIKKEQENSEYIPEVTLNSRREAFNKRYAKYQNLLDNTKQK